MKMKVKVLKHALAENVADEMDVEVLYSVGENMVISYDYMVGTKFEYGTRYNVCKDTARVVVVDHIVNAMNVPVRTEIVLKTSDKAFIERMGTNVFSMSQQQLVGRIL